MAPKQRGDLSARRDIANSDLVGIKGLLARDQVEQNLVVRGLSTLDRGWRAAVGFIDDDSAKYARDLAARTIRCAREATQLALTANEEETIVPPFDEAQVEQYELLISDQELALRSLYPNRS